MTERHCRILGMDLGTNTGVAFVDIMPGQPVTAATFFAGQLYLGVGDYDSGLLRLVRLQTFMEVLRPDIVLYEYVRYTPAAMEGQSPRAMLARAATASEFLGALKAAVGLWCQQHDVPCEGVPIQDIKKAVTGRGNAGKEDIIRAVNDRYGCALPVEDHQKTGADNVADAIGLCAIGVEQYADGIMPAGPQLFGVEGT